MMKRSAGSIEYMKGSDRIFDAPGMDFFIFYSGRFVAYKLTFIATLALKKN